MRRHFRITSTITLVACAVAVGSFTSPALAAPSSESEGDTDKYSFLAPIAVPDSLEARATVPDEYSAETGMPADVSHRLIQMTLDHPELRIASAQWDSDREQLTLHSAADAGTATALLQDYELSDWVEYAEAVRSADELNAIVEDMIGDTGKLATGQQVALVKPSADAARIELVLDEEQAATTRHRVALPDLSTPELAVDVTYGAMPEPAVRNIDGSTYRFSGAYMTNTPAGGQFVAGCTTGYRLVQNGTSAAAMGSAHHCGVGVNRSGIRSADYPAWWYSSEGAANGWSLGYFQGGIYPGGATYGDSAVWTGGGVGSLYPAILIGGNTGASSSATLIRGAVSAAVGNRVCYSGSYSGSVCNNYVDDTNVTACYGAPYPCYNGLVLTHQTTGVPAAGQGDSGGPVYGTSNGEAYAVGIISGIRNATTTCTGDGGRLCSTEVLYSPIAEYFGAGYGVAYVPAS